MHTGFALQTRLKVNPQLVMTGKLLQVTAVEIEQCIYDELAQNPALELANSPEPSGIMEPSSMGHIPMRLSPVDELIAQTRLMVDRCDLDTAVFLLHSLDRHGYLNASSAELAAELGVTVDTINRVIHVLHQLEPPGIGARNLQECLLIQCDHLESNGTECLVARRIVEETWSDFTRHRWQHISKRLGISKQQIDHVRRLIFRHFYPYPLLLLGDADKGRNAFHRPDIIIQKEAKSIDNQFKILIPEMVQFDLTLSNSFEYVLQNQDEAYLSAEAQSWINDAVERARLFITALNQRWETLSRIGAFLAAFQADFLQSGPLYMKPLTRSAVAEELGLHESTVGRAIRNKVVQLPDSSLILMSQFFDASLAPKEAIRQLLECTNAPISDREIASRLEANGIHLARRTITKYRRQLQILPVNQRHRCGIFSGYVEG